MIELLSSKSLRSNYKKPFYVLIIISILCWGYFTIFYQKPINVKSYTTDDIYYKLYNSKHYYSVQINNVYIEKGKENVYNITLSPEKDKDGTYDMDLDFVGNINMELPFSQYQSVIGENSNRVTLKCSFLELTALCKYRKEFDIDAYKKIYRKYTFLNDSNFEAYSLNNMREDVEDFIDGIKTVETGIVNGDYDSRNSIYDKDTAIKTIPVSLLDRGATRTSIKLDELLDGYTKY